MDPMLTRLDELLTRMSRIESAVDLLVQQRTVKDCYTPAEVAVLLGKAEFTVREWCRQGRVNATKRAFSRGPFQEWVISHAELQRIVSEGLLPPPGK